MKAVIWVVCVVMICAGIYSCFWVAKHTSYFFFYEGLVKETIREVVKQEALKP